MLCSARYSRSSTRAPLMSEETSPDQPKHLTSEMGVPSCDLHSMTRIRFSTHLTSGT